MKARKSHMHRWIAWVMLPANAHRNTHVAISKAKVHVAISSHDYICGVLSLLLLLLLLLLATYVDEGREWLLTAHSTGQSNHDSDMTAQNCK